MPLIQERMSECPVCHEISVPKFSFNSLEWAEAFAVAAKAKPEIATDVETMRRMFQEAWLRGYKAPKPIRLTPYGIYRGELPERAQDYSDAPPPECTPELEGKKNELMNRAQNEWESAKTFSLPVHMDLFTLSCVVGNLHLALRHPANIGPSAEHVRYVVDRIIEALEHEGYPATAQIMRLGDDRNYDSIRTLREDKDFKGRETGGVAPFKEADENSPGKLS
jgi:hypothetical protein